MTFELRDYQEDAVKAALANPGLIIAGTGSGKTVMIAEMVRQLRRYGARVLTVTHSQELVSQNADTIAAHTGAAPSVLAGNLGRHEVDGDCVVANIASAHRHRKRLLDAGRIDVAIIDESHRHNPDGKQYAETIADMLDRNPDLPLIGLTGSPWRHGHGFIAGEGKRGQAPIWSHVAHEVDTGTLLREGHLVPVRGRRPDEKIDLTGVQTDNTGDYRQSQLREAIDDETTARCVAELVEYARQSGRVRILAYGIDVEHCEFIANELRHHGARAAVVSAYTPAQERRALVHAYRMGHLDCLVSVAALAVGFDVRDVNLIGLFRPTRSPALFAQIGGRGARPWTCPETGRVKRDCVMMDFGGSYLLHGPPQHINWRRCDPTEAKKSPRGWTCPECSEMLPAEVRTCSECGHEKPAPKPAPSPQRAPAGRRISTVDAAAIPPRPCTGLRLDTYRSRNGRVCLRWSYRVEGISHPICTHIPMDAEQMIQWAGRVWIEHGGSEPIPRNPQQAVMRAGELVRPVGVTVAKNEKGYWNVLACHFAGDPALTNLSRDPVAAAA